MSRREVARRIGVTAPWLGKRLRHQQDMRLEDLEEIAKVVGFDPLEIVVEARRGTDR